MPQPQPKHQPTDDIKTYEEILDDLVEAVVTSWSARGIEIAIAAEQPGPQPEPEPDAKPEGETLR